MAQSSQRSAARMLYKGPHPVCGLDYPCQYPVLVT
jgi:hypothetical protein